MVTGEYGAFYELVVKRFKQSCADNGMVETGSPSLEDCIVGLRQALRTMANLELKVVHEEDFIQLQHTTRQEYQVSFYTSN